MLFSEGTGRAAYILLYFYDGAIATICKSDQYNRCTGFKIIEKTTTSTRKISRNMIVHVQFVPPLKKEIAKLGVACLCSANVSEKYTA